MCNSISDIESIFISKGAIISESKYWLRRRIHGDVDDVLIKSIDNVDDIIELFDYTYGFTYETYVLFYDFVKRVFNFNLYDSNENDQFFSILYNKNEEEKYKIIESFADITSLNILKRFITDVKNRKLFYVIEDDCESTGFEFYEVNCSEYIGLD